VPEQKDEEDWDRGERDPWLEQRERSLAEAAEATEETHRADEWEDSEPRESSPPETDRPFSPEVKRLAFFGPIIGVLIFVVGGLGHLEVIMASGVMIVLGTVAAAAVKHYVLRG
jgi:hypothetical protein